MAMDFDLLCNTRLFLFDQKQAEAQLDAVTGKFDAGSDDAAPKQEAAKPEEW